MIAEKLRMIKLKSTEPSPTLQASQPANTNGLAPVVTASQLSTQEITQITNKFIIITILKGFQTEW